MKAGTLYFKKAKEAQNIRNLLVAAYDIAAMPLENPTQASRPGAKLSLEFLRENRTSYLAFKSMTVLQAERLVADPAVSMCSWKRIWNHVFMLCQQKYAGT